MKFGLFYEHQLPRALGRDIRAAPLPGSAGSGRAGRSARHRLRLGGRAPFPRGVLPFLRAGGLPGRVLAAHQADPPRSRRHADVAEVQPPRPRRRAHRDAGPRIERPGRVGHRRVRHRARDGRLRHTAQREDRHVGRGGRAGGQHAGDDALSRLQGPVLRDAVPQHRAQAGAAAAPADVDGLLAPRDDPPRRAAWAGRACLRLHRAGAGRASGSRNTTTSSSRTSASRSATPSIPTSRSSAACPSTRTSRRRSIGASTASGSSATRSATSACTASTSPASRRCGRSSWR